MSVFETSTRVNANWKVSVLYISSLIILTFILFSAQVEADAVKELIHFKDGISEASVKGKIDVMKAAVMP